MLFSGKVSVCDDPAMYGRIETDFICNRFDLTGNYEFALLKWRKNRREYYVQVSFEDDKAFLGIWLAPITAEILKDVSRFIFRKYKTVRTVEYRFGTIPYGKAFPCNHFKIELPETADALRARMTQKSRYNLRRSRRLLEESVGPVDFVSYPADDVPTEMIGEYLRLKKASHGFEFDAPPEEYLRIHGVSDVYIMRAGDGRMLSIILSCEQCRVVFLENLTYNPEFRQYSPGQILYEYYLERLIEKKRDLLFLMGGDYEYKRRYGSVEETVYFGTMYKGFRQNWDQIYKKKWKRRYKEVRHRIKLLLTRGK